MARLRPIKQTLIGSIDRYIDERFAEEDYVLKHVKNSSRNGGLADIAVSPGQGKFLYLQAKMIGAKHILELGTLGGYSAIWLARALPKTGRLVTIDNDVDAVDIARNNIRFAGLTDKVEVKQGQALSFLEDLIKDIKSAQIPPFDLIFMDNDKQNYPAYLDRVTELLRPGGLLLADNVIRGGHVLPGTSRDAKADGAATFNELLAEHPEYEAIILQQVGLKGHDGLAMARKRDQ